MSYNGWTNWATWNVELWLDNDEGLYRAKQSFIRHSHREIEADDVEQFCSDLFPNGRTPDMQRTSEMKDVNWQELAEHWQAEKEEDAAA